MLNLTEAERSDLCNRIPKFHLVVSSNPHYDSKGFYARRWMFLWVDLEPEQMNFEYIEEELDKALLSARIPSDGLDPFIMGIDYHFSPTRNRAFISLEVASHLF